MINRIILEGRLGGDPQKRTTSTDKVICVFSIPLFNRFKRENDPTEWVNVEIWNKPAEYLLDNLKKGMLVSVEGSLRVNVFEKNGANQYRHYISADRVTILESRAKREGSNSSYSNNQTSNYIPINQGGNNQPYNQPINQNNNQYNNQNSNHNPINNSNKPYTQQTPPSPPQQDNLPFGSPEEEDDFQRLLREFGQ